MGRVLVVGESLVDIVIRPNGDRAEFPGGSPLNVAIGLARLGVDVLLHTSIGDDERGALIRSHVSGSGAGLAPESAAPGATSTATATIDHTGAATYDFELAWAPVGLEVGDDTIALHTGSIAAVVEPGATAVRRLLEQARSRRTISYDPNIRAGIMGPADEVRPIVEAIVGLSDVVKASDEDLEWLYPTEDPLAVASRWARGGPAIVIVTRGSRGPWAIAAGGSVEVSAPVARVADTVGAGDSFMAGVIAALADRDLLGADRRSALAGIDLPTLEAVVAFAARCAAVTVSRPGADPPTRAELA